MTCVIKKCIVRSYIFHNLKVASKENELSGNTISHGFGWGEETLETFLFAFICSMSINRVYRLVPID